MNRAMKVVVLLVAIVALLVLWPNLVHEQLHLVALTVQGVKGQVHYDWSFPARPWISREGQLASLGGGLLFLLLPSVVSIVILVLLWLTRRSASLLTYIVLPAYLGFDLVLNILKFSNPISDFHFLVLVSAFVPIVAAFVVGCGACAVVLWGAQAEFGVLAEREEVKQRGEEDE